MVVHHGPEEFLESWRRTTEPIRPSVAELACMRRQLLEGHKAPRTLILGLTPELVDLAVEAGAGRVAVIDLRPDAIAVLPRLGTQDWSSVETLMDDWTNYRAEFEEAFDVLLGHGSLVHAAFPEGWRTTFATWRRYLAPGGRAILRTFVMPPGGCDFTATYQFLVRNFESLGDDADAPPRVSAFMRLSSEVRCLAILRAARRDGSIDHHTFAKTIAFIGSDLRSRFEGDPIWSIGKSEFGAPTAIGFETLWPLAAPTWSDAQALIEQAGFNVTHEFIGSRPVADCFCVATAIRAS